MITTFDKSVSLFIFSSLVKLITTFKIFVNDGLHIKIPFFSIMKIFPFFKATAEGYSNDKSELIFIINRNIMANNKIFLMNSKFGK